MGIYIDRGYTLEEAKQACGHEVESWYGGATLDVFDCDVLGPMYRYECNESAQLRFLHGKTSNLPITLVCGQVPAEPDTDPVYSHVSHSATECGKVHSAYLDFIKASAVRFQLLKTQLAACLTVEQVEAVLNDTWGT